MSSESQGERLPFEPKNKKKKAPKKSSSSAPETPEKVEKQANSSATAIPDVVSKRMLRRMALFSGIPTALGVSSFLVSYLIVSQEWFDLPTVVVLIVTIILFGLGFLGLSYGFLSASWDEDRAGSWLGLEQVGTNFGRLTGAWRAAREAKRE